MAQKLSFKSQLTDVDTTAMDDLGCIRMEENKVYKYVQFGATRTTNLTGALAAGDVACYVLGTTADLDLMTLVNSSNSAVGAGVVQATVAATGGPLYGWLQLKGVATLNQTMAGSPEEGDALTTASAADKLMTKVVTDNAWHCAQLVDDDTTTAPVVLLDFPY